MTTTEVPPVTAAPPAPRRRPRIVLGRFRTTPARMSVVLFSVVLLGVASGLVGWFAVQQKFDLVQDMTRHSSPLGASALDIYRSLSDADATAASAFLTGGSEPPTLRARYLDSIARAAAAVTAASTNTESGSAGATELMVLSMHLPVYTGLVETARAINRQHFPLGAAYLREASGLMRTTLLPAAERLYRTENSRLASAQAKAAAFPSVAVGLGVLTAIVLIAAQVYLTRRTNRVFNIGLVLATVAALAAVSWIASASVAAARHVEAGRREGSTQMHLLAEARIAAAQARSDEAVTLLARGSGQESEDHFAAMMLRIQGTDGLLAQASAGTTDPARRAALDATRDKVVKWMNTHSRLRESDDKGLHQEAIALATGSKPDDVPSLFGGVDVGLSDSFAERSARFDQEITAAEHDLAGLGLAVPTLTLIIVIGVAVGVQRRIAEYK